MCTPLKSPHPTAPAVGCGTFARSAAASRGLTGANDAALSLVTASRNSTGARASDKNPVERPELQLDKLTRKRINVIHNFFMELVKIKCVVVSTAPNPLDNCVLGWSSVIVKDELVFVRQLERVLQHNHAGIWTDFELEGSSPQERADFLISSLLTNVQVHSTRTNEIGRTPLSPMRIVKGWKFERDRFPYATKQISTPAP